MAYAVWRADWIDWKAKFDDKRFARLDSANAEFLLLDVTVRNDDTEPRQIPQFHLIDENGASYETSSQAFRLDESFGVFESLNPGVTTTGLILFDVPKKHQYKLKLSGGYWSKESALVEVVARDRPHQQDRYGSASVAQTPNTALPSMPTPVVTTSGDVNNPSSNTDEVSSSAEPTETIEERKAKAIDAAKWRYWTAKDGTKKAEAKFRSFANGDVTLEKRDGTTLTLSTSLLVDDDLQFILERRWLKIAKENGY